MIDLSEKSTELKENNLGRLCQKAGRAYSDKALSLLHQKGFADVTLSHTALFANLDLNGTIITTIAERAGMTKQAMGQLASDLEKKGYINKTRDLNDRRAILIQFTQLGRDAVRLAYDIKIVIEKEYNQILGKENIAILRELLQKLVRG